MMLHGPASNIFVAGDASGVDAPRAAAESGRLAARAALASLGALPDGSVKIAAVRERLRAASIPLHARARESLMTGVFPDEVMDGWDAAPGTVVCPCEGVTVDALREALGDGAQAPHDLRRMTGCGAGECGGRRCEGAMLRWLAGALDLPISRLTLPPIQPPARPVPVSALAAPPSIRPA
jgi:bacterioferritin-associated ferredoxin